MPFAATAILNGERKFHSAKWAARWILIPNPVYGSWERATCGFARTLPDAGQTNAEIRSAGRVLTAATIIDSKFRHHPA